MATIRKRKLADGKTTWQADYRDQQGKRRHRQFATKREADAFLVQARAEVAGGTHTPLSQSITVLDASRLWLGSCLARGLERSTYAGYEGNVRLYILPRLGHLKLSLLTAPLIRDFEDALRSNGPEGFGLKPLSVRTARMCLGALIAEAQERGLVTRNVVRELSSKRTRGKEKRADKRQKGKLKVGVDIPSPDEMKKIVHALQGRHRPSLVTAIFTGLRSSELRGLRWSDVDFKNRVISVWQRMDRYKVSGATKSESGQRKIPVPSIVINTLREWKLACPKGERDLVFPTSTGQPTEHGSIVQRGLEPALLRAGLTKPKVDDKTKMPILDGSGKPVLVAKYSGLHFCRHFYASWCINRKADGGLELPPKMVQERLGHASIVMTMDVYGHLFPSTDDAEGMDAAERALLG